MARILTVSIPKDADHVVDELKALGGSVSSHVVEAILMYLKAKGQKTPPYWYVAGKDYSHLPLETRKGLRQFGYTDPELEISS